MPLADNALTTLEAVKDYLKIPIGTTVDDLKLEDLNQLLLYSYRELLRKKVKGTRF
jgi:hypothetical protein